MQLSHGVATLGCWRLQRLTRVVAVDGRRRRVGGRALAGATSDGAGAEAKEALLADLRDAFSLKPPQRVAEAAAPPPPPPAAAPISEPPPGSDARRSSGNGAGKNGRAKAPRAAAGRSSAAATAPPPAPATTVREAGPTSTTGGVSVKVGGRQTRYSALIQSLADDAANPRPRAPAPPPPAAAPPPTPTPPSPPQQRRASSRRSPSVSSTSFPRPPRAPRVKEYAPVMKGDLALPGGPQWQALRRHVVAAGASPALPALRDALVIVEGDADAAAVARAANVAVYVCDGTRAVKEHAQGELRALAGLGRRLVALTDPDERGRELRAHLDDALAGAGGELWHAFMAEGDATSAVDGRVHAAGNRGVEHAPPDVVAAALSGARCSSVTVSSGADSGSNGKGAPWSAERLRALGVASAFDEAGPAAEAAAARRRALCARLGLGACSVAQLVAALNRWFANEDGEAAVEGVLSALG